MDPKPQPQKAQEDNGTQDVNTTGKTLQSYDQQSSSETLQSQPQTQAQEDNGTQDVNTTTKAGQSYKKTISSATLGAERKDTQVP